MADTVTSDVTVTAGHAKRVFTGLGAATIMLAVSYGTNFALVPLILRAWGQPGYTLWVTLFALVSYLALVDLGGQVYVQSVLAGDYARGRLDAFRSTLSAGMALYLWGGVGSWLVWCALSEASTVIAFPFIGRTATVEESRILILLGGAQLCLAIPFGIFAAAYRAAGRFTRGTLLGNVNKAAWLAAAVGILLCGGTPVQLAGAYVVVSLGSVAVLLWDSRRSIGFVYPLHWGPRAARRGLPLLKHSMFNWLLTLSTIVTQQIGILALATVGPDTAVSAYATHRLVANVAGYVPALLSGPVLPEMSFLWSLGDRRGFRNVVVRSAACVALATVLVAAALYAGVPVFFAWWTRRQVEYQPLLLALLLADAVLSAGVTAAGWAFVATNRQRLFSAVSMVSAAFLVISAFTVLPRWGVLWFVGSFVACDAAMLLVAVPCLLSRVATGLAWPLVRGWSIAMVLSLGCSVAVLGLGTAIGGTIGAAVAVLAAAGAAASFGTILWRRWRPAATAP